MTDTSTADAEKNALVQSVSNLFQNKEHSDVEIICGNRNWRMHKNILCARSEWFKKACSPQWTSTPYPVDKNKTITLNGDNPDAVAAMLKYLYSGDYDDKNIAGVAPLSFNVIVNTTADKYNLTALCKLAEKKFNTCLDAGDWNKKDFGEALSTLWSQAHTWQAGMRNIVLGTIVKHADTLLKVDGPNNIRQKIAANGQLGLDLSTAFHTSKSSGWKCPNCRKVLSHVLPRTGQSFYCCGLTRYANSLVV